MCLRKRALIEARFYFTDKNISMEISLHFHGFALPLLTAARFRICLIAILPSYHLFISVPDEFNAMFADLVAATVSAGMKVEKAFIDKGKE